MPSAQVLNGILHSLNLLRNISAHRGRLRNRLIVKRLPKIKKVQHLLVLEDACPASSPLADGQLHCRRTGESFVALLRRLDRSIAKVWEQEFTMDELNG